MTDSMVSAVDAISPAALQPDLTVQQPDSSGTDTSSDTLAARRLSLTSSLLQDAQRTRTSKAGSGAGSRKRSSIFGFLSLKDPSTAALQHAAKEHKKQVTLTTARPSTATSTQRLPPNVPKVNSKWDGLPPSAAAARDRTKSQLSFRRHSTASSSTKSSGSNSSSHRPRRSAKDGRSLPHSYSMQAIISGTTPATSKQSSPRNSSIVDRPDSATAMSPIIPPASTPFAAPGPISRGLAKVKEDDTESGKLPGGSLSATSTKLDLSPDTTAAAAVSLDPASLAVTVEDQPDSTIESKPILASQKPPVVPPKSSKRLSIQSFDANGLLPAIPSETSSPQSLSSASSAIKTARTTLETPPSSVPVSPAVDKAESDKVTKPRLKTDPARLSRPFGIASVDSRPVLDATTSIVSDTELVPAVPPRHFDHVATPNNDETVTSIGHVRSTSHEQSSSPRRINFSKPFARTAAPASAGVLLPPNVPRSRFAVEPPSAHNRNWSEDSAISQSTYALFSGDAPTGGTVQTNEGMTPRHETISDLRRSRRLTAESQTLSLRPTVDGPMSSLPAW